MPSLSKQGHQEINQIKILTLKKTQSQQSKSG